MEELLDALEGKAHRCDYDGLIVAASDNGRYCYAPITHLVTLGEIVDLLEALKNQPKTLVLPEIPNQSFAKKLYSTYLSYLPREAVSFPLKMRCWMNGQFYRIVEDCEKRTGFVNI